MNNTKEIEIHEISITDDALISLTLQLKPTPDKNQYDDSRHI